MEGDLVFMKVIQMGFTGLGSSFFYTRWYDCNSGGGKLKAIIDMSTSIMLAKIK